MLGVLFTFKLWEQFLSNTEHQQVLNIDLYWLRPQKREIITNFS